MQLPVRAPEGSDMVESSKITEKATELAGQAVQAAGPYVERAKEVAGELAVKAGPYVDRAAVLAAHGVSAAAEQIDKATHGKYSSRISSVSSKIEEALDRSKP
jgi:hypothetical protein